MIDRAAVAGIAIGVGATLICLELFRGWPNFIVLGAGFLLVCLGGVAYSDLREEHHNELEARRAHR